MKIAIAGLLGISLQNVFVDDLYTLKDFLLGLFVFLITFIVVKAILGMLTAKLIKHFFKYLFLALIISSVIAVAYVLYLLNTPPIKSSFLERNKYSDVFTTLNIRYATGLTNREYSKIAYQYRVDLYGYYKGNLSDLERNVIWQNYKRIYSLQTAIQMLFYAMHDTNILGDILKYRYNSLVKSYVVDGEIQTYSNGNEGAVIPVNFKNKPDVKFSLKDYGLLFRVDLPYFNNSFPIHKDDKYKYILVNKYLHQTHALLQKNRLYKKVLTSKYTNINSKTTNEEFHEMWGRLNTKEQQQMSKSFDENKPIKGFRQGL